MNIEASKKLALTIAETVAATGVGRTSLYAEIKAGRLRAVKMGKKRTLIPIAAVHAWLAALPACDTAA